MLRGDEATARGPRYRAKAVRNDPPPLQERLPILVGGSGERKTLRTVARFADAWNTGGDIEKVRHKEGVLRRWCDEVGRDHTEIERTYGAGGIVIRDDPAEGRRVAEEMSRHNGGWGGPEHVGTAEEIAGWLRPYVELGFRHIFFDAPQPHDHETIERFIGEVKPMLEWSAAFSARDAPLANSPGDFVLPSGS
jgi:alkanesulfonate monooxygenase SsuD/methylene tetrahydromethanopterin reductase-like flavin-dependent oxidoreductase (luciferase family)